MRSFWIGLLAIVLSGCTGEPEITTQGPHVIATLERTWQLGSGPGRQVAFSRDGALLASADATGEVVVRRTSDWKPVSSLRHDGGATAVAFAPGNQLLTAGYDGLLRAWELGNARELNHFTGAGGPIWTIDVSPDDKHAASASEDGIIHIWSLDGSSAPLKLKGHQRNIWNLRFSSDGKQLASGSFDKTARIWDAATGKSLHTLNGHQQAVVGLDLSNDGRTLFTGGDDSTIRIWRTKDGAPLKRIDAGNHIYSVELSPDERWLATGGRARSGFGTLWHQLTGSGGDAQPAKLWRVSDMAVVATLPHPDDVMSVAFSPDGQWLVTSGEDGKARLWRLKVQPR